MRSFQDIVDDLIEVEGGFQASITEEWRQGRTAYGGLTTGLMMAVVSKIFPDLPQLRSIQVNFTGPVSELCILQVSLMRRGRNVTTIRVDVMSEKDLSATAILSFGLSRASVLQKSLPAPPTKPIETYKLFTPPGAENFVPPFFLRFDSRLIEGARPVSGAKEGYVRVWSRHKAKNSREGMASFLTIGDVLPPAALPTLTEFGPISSMNWHMNILRPPETHDGWWHIETRQTAAQDGYSSQVMRFWNSEGELVAEGMQSVAIFV